MTAPRIGMRQRERFLRVERKAEGILQIIVHQGVKYSGSLDERDRALWTLGRTRKLATCACCNGQIPGGAQAYRPITERMYRGWRLCGPCASALLTFYNPD